MRAPCSRRMATPRFEDSVGTFSTEQGTSLPCTTLSTADAIYFDTLAVPEPAGPWSYVLDDCGIRYGSGAWPFYRSDRASVLPSGRDAAVVRVSPDREYRMWRNQEVRLYPQPVHNPVRIRLTLWVCAHEIGAWVLPTEARLWLPTRAWVWQIDVPESLRVAAADARDRILQFLDLALRERDAGAIAPQTAHSRWAAESAAPPEPTSLP